MEIKAPEKYINEVNIIKDAGKYISEYGKRALIVGGKTALNATEIDIHNSFIENEINYETFVFAGYPSMTMVNRIVQECLRLDADVLVAVGGGRVMDATKTAGDITGNPVVTIPTVAATCASWAAVSIIYTQEGDFEKVHINKYSPRVVLVDPNIIVNSPERFLKAGIVDTYAKWYELAPGIKGREDNIGLQVSLQGARLAFEQLDINANKALEDVRKHVVTKEVVNTIDAIIFLAGYVGSVVGVRAFSGFAHPFYHASRRISSSRHMLHGELVAYGILTQLVLEKKTQKYIDETIDKFAEFDEAFTLKEIGIGDNTNEKLHVIAERAIREFPGFVKLFSECTQEDVTNALLNVDKLVNQRR